MPAQVPSTGVPARTSSRSGSREALALDPECHHRRLAAGDDSASSPSRSAGTRTSRELGAEARQELGVGLEVALEGEDADQRRPPGRVGVGHRYQPRGASSCSDSSFELSRLTIGCPRPVDAAATRAASR